MIPVEEITKSLPPMRDDEPPSLRQDIVDEILDHLQCGLRRELLVLVGDEPTAKQRALEKFGDPQQIARKLWFQAMWSKIMIQRLVIGSTICSMLVSVALVVIVGWMVHQQQQMNSALINQMGLLSQRSNDLSTSANSRFTHLQLKVSLGRENGRAADGYVVFVSKQQGIGEAMNPHRVLVKRQIGQAGMADFGYVEPGEFQVQIQSPWGEFATSEFMIQPGKDHLEQIVVPEKPREHCHMSVNLDEWPKELAEKGFLVSAEFYLKKPRQFAGRAWRQVMTREFFLFPAQGRSWISETLTPRAASGLAGLAMAMANQFSAELNPGLIASETDGETSKADHAKSATWTPTDQWGLPAGEYRVESKIWGIAITGGLSPDDEGWQNAKILDRQSCEVYNATLVVSDQLGKDSEWKISPSKSEVDDLHKEVRDFIKTQEGSRLDELDDINSFRVPEIPDDAIKPVGDSEPDIPTMRLPKIPMPIDDDDQPKPVRRNQPRPKPEFIDPKDLVPGS